MRRNCRIGMHLMFSRNAVVQCREKATPNVSTQLWRRDCLPKLATATEVEASQMLVLARNALLVILAFACASTNAVAQQKFPNGTVRIVAPYVPGGAVDIAARALADLLAERWGSPVIVENRTGAATAIGTNAVATATPDGHTLLLTAT